MPIVRQNWCDISKGICTNKSESQDIAGGIATDYGLDGPGIEFRWGELSCTRPDWPWGPPVLLYNRYLVSFPGVKRSGRGVDHAPPSSADVKQKVELSLYSPSGPSRPVLQFIGHFRHISEFWVGKDWSRYSTDMLLIRVAKLSKSFF